MPLSLGVISPAWNGDWFVEENMAQVCSRVRPERVS
jgi:hypothetical protein